MLPSFLKSVSTFFKSVHHFLFRRSRPFKLTGPGWVFILYTIGVGAAAINTGNNLLYLIFGIFLGLILASGVLSDMSLWGMTASVELPVSARAGETAAAFVHVENRKRWLPSISVHVEIAAMLRNRPLRFSIYVPFLSAGTSSTVVAPMTLPGRGLLRVERITLRTRYPFGLLRKWWAVRGAALAADECVVTPALIKEGVTPPRPGQGRQDDARLGSERGEGSVVMGLKEYRVGDNPRRIHWKGSARRGQAVNRAPQWLMREMEQEQREEVWLRWPSSRRLAGAEPERVERFVSYVATLLQCYEQLAFDVGFVMPVSGQEQAVPMNPDEASRFLALWEPFASEKNSGQDDIAPEISRRAVDVWSAFNEAR